ncbi:hypothetical protein [Muricoccus radiodurans]|uniref:hypothetical protein n=1 Tax=Muricoccus radiodurans TaxID=2231721 RepID=UPI003CF712AA
MMNRRSMLLALAGLAIAGQAVAQGAPSRRIRGVITGLEGRNLLIRTREGESVTVLLADNVTVVALRRLELSEVRPGSFIGTAAEPDGDGGWRALEVLVFPEAMRGTGEGHFAWDLTPSSSMTNANVTAAVDGTNGRELVLHPRGQEIRVRVPADAPVVTFIPAALEDLKPGAQVFLSAAPNAGGQLSAARITVARDGVVPPM